MRDLAWPSVKLFAPAAGAPGLLALGLATAGVLASGFAGARVFCAPAPCASPTAKTAMAAAAYSAFMDRFLFVSRLHGNSLAGSCVPVPNHKLGIGRSLSHTTFSRTSTGTLSIQMLRF